VDEGAWRAVEQQYLAALEAEFITPGGQFIPCRSTYLGFAMPQMGGAVAQGLPCFFLNATLPAIANRQWEIVRRDLREETLARTIWPIDTGNYGFSRASSYAGTAAAAVELGDTESAALLLDALERECPRQVDAGVAHRPRASLWAHAVEVLARSGRTNGLADLVARPPERSGPHIAHAPYPRALVASAQSDGQALQAVLHGQGVTEMTLAGLTPSRSYNANTLVFRTDERGEARVTVALNGRTPIMIAPEA
jgi:hypothetical protein